MALEIWKFTLLPMANVIEMPDHARVLSTAFQGEDLRIWAVVVPSNVQRKRRFFVAGTGWRCANDQTVGPFVGTALHHDGLVFHVFDRGYEPRSPQETGQ